MRAWFACQTASFLKRELTDVEGALAKAQQDRGFSGSADQGGAWTEQLSALRTALLDLGVPDWTIALEYELLRLEKRVDAIILTDRAIIVLEFKTAAASAAALSEPEDYALDLRDFHAGSRHHAIVPMLVSHARDGFAPPRQPWLLPPVPTEPLVTGANGLAAALRWVQANLPTAVTPLDGDAWLAAPYRPVPTIIEAATMLYARAGVREIATARADAASLNRTSAAILRHLEAAQRECARVAIFVTGIPGAGKTLCGLNAVFGSTGGGRAAFLTGNLPLVAVLREALARDAIARGTEPSEARRRTKTALQNVHNFLEEGARDSTVAPPEHLIVFDEAQRAWDEKKSRQGPRNKRSKLTMSEAAHALDIMARVPGWSALVALIGNGQEINTGEAGLAEWGRVLATRSDWRAVAAPATVGADEPAQCLTASPQPWLSIDSDLHLDASIRTVREPAAAAWVDAILRNARGQAQAVAANSSLPFFVTRSLDDLRAALRHLARGQRRAGLVASSGAKRLRAEGLGVQAASVEHWFLDRWPDVRASDALETFATEYDCQGLELDVVGLIWGGDLVRGAQGWLPRRFSGTRWQTVRKAEDQTFVRNTYRVLLTRARYETVIWVPRGSGADDPFHDVTRPAAEMDAIADFLLACGARPLETASASPVPTLL